MTHEGHAVALLSGELTVEQRADIIGRFREGKEKVLITTNVSARGTCPAVAPWNLDCPWLKPRCSQYMYVTFDDPVNPRVVLKWNTSDCILYSDSFSDSLNRP